MAGQYSSDIIDDPDKLAFVFALKVGHRCEPGTGLHCKHQPLPMVASCCNRGMMCDRTLPPRTRIIRDRAVAADNEMALQILRTIWPAVPVEVAAAGIDGPGHIPDLAFDEGFVPGFAITDCDTDRDLGFPFLQIENPVADDQLNPQSRIACMKSINEWGPPEKTRQA